VGFKGPDCEKATQFLEEALGVVGKKIKKTEASGHLMQRGEEWGLVVDFSRLETKRLVLIRLESAGVEVALRTDSD